MWITIKYHPHTLVKRLFFFSFLQREAGWLLEYVKFESLEGLSDSGVQNYSQYRSYFFQPSKLSSHFESRTSYGYD